jgi:hypothetical protein
MGYTHFMLLAINLELSNKDLVLDDDFMEKVFERCKELAEDFTGCVGTPLFGKNNDGTPSDEELETVDSLINFLNDDFPDIVFDVYIINHDGKELERWTYINGEPKIDSQPFILPKNINIRYTIDDFHVECNLSSAFYEEYEDTFDIWSDGILSEELNEKRMKKFYEKNRLPQVSHNWQPFDNNKSSSIQNQAHSLTNQWIDRRSKEQIYEDNKRHFIGSATVGNLKTMVDYMNWGINIHVDDDQALIGASEKGYLNVVKFLVEHGANINAQNGKALQVAIDNNHRRVSDYLINHMQRKGDKLTINWDYLFEFTADQKPKHIINNIILSENKCDSTLKIDKVNHNLLNYDIGIFRELSASFYKRVPFLEEQLETWEHELINVNNAIIYENSYGSINYLKYTFESETSIQLIILINNNKFCIIELSSLQEFSFITIWSNSFHYTGKWNGLINEPKDLSDKKILKLAYELFQTIY